GCFARWSRAPWTGGQRPSASSIPAFRARRATASSSSTSPSGPSLASRPSSTPGFRMPSGEAVRRVAVLTVRHDAGIDDALERLRPVAEAEGVEVVDEHGEPDLVVVLGGDGTMLRALHRFGRAGIPVLGVNFGRVGFLTSFGPDELEAELRRVLAGSYVVHPL